MTSFEKWSIIELRAGSTTGYLDDLTYGIPVTGEESRLMATVLTWVPTT